MYKTLNKKLKIEQHALIKNLEWTQVFHYPQKYSIYRSYIQTLYNSTSKYNSVLICWMFRW